MGFNDLKKRASLGEPTQPKFFVPELTMKLRMLPSMTGPGPLQYLSTYVVNEVCSVDAGALGMVGTPQEQARVDHVFLTHSHLDHIAGLPIFLDTVLDLGEESVQVLGLESVLHDLKAHVFNDRVMPDFLRISQKGPVFLRTNPIEVEKPVEVAGLRFTAFPVVHPVDCVGYIVDDGHAAVAIVTDTSPLDSIWHRLETVPRLKAVLLDCSFPKSHAKLAEISGHCTTEQFFQAAKRLGAICPVYAIHIKPRFYEEVLKELHELGFPPTQIFLPDRDYFFE